MLTLHPLDVAISVSDHMHLKILTPAKILQKLPVALVLVKASSTFENLLSEIRQITYS